MNEAHEVLMLRYLDGTASDADVRALDELLRTDPAARDALLRAAELDAALTALDTGEPTASGIRRRRRRRRTSRIMPRQNSPAWLPIAAAVAVAAVLSLWVWVGLSGTRAQPELSVLVVRGTVTMDGALLRQASSVPPGSLIQTQDGAQVRLRYLDGTEVVLRGDTTCRVVSNSGCKHLRLSRGALAGNVVAQPPSQPFRIATANSEARVVGTRFDLVAQAADFTRLDVRSGLVRLAYDGHVLDVAAGQAAIASSSRAFALLGTEPTARQHSGLTVTLLDPANKAPVMGLDPMPANATLRLSSLPRKINMRLNGLPPSVQAIRVTMNGEPFGRGGSGKDSLEQHEPLLIVGDDRETGRWYGWRPDPGEYRMNVEFFADDEASRPAPDLEPFLYTFTVVD